MEGDERNLQRQASNWVQIQALFHEAVELNPSARAAWLDQVVGRGTTIRCELESLLACDTGPSERGSPGSDPEPTGSNEVNTPPGTWKFVRELGRGGMGIVYLAEKPDPGDASITLRAAIKVLRHQPDADIFWSRFRLERQILARLEHSYIACFLEGGSLSNGLPYYALEYINGVQIDRFVEEQALPLRAILELGLKVCAAVDFAHRNLVVHRDLKPSNILVTADSNPHLLDFGIAKVLATDGLASLTTAVGAFPLTPGYTSPEQIEGKNITTASDIFSLGIVLYELIAGTHPFLQPNETGSMSPAQIYRRVCENTPRRLSENVSPARLESQGDRYARRLRGDLEVIVAKALEKEPARRYSSVEQLSDDLQRFLDAKPILARRHSLGYRLTKFAQRHPSAAVSSLIAAATVLITMLMVLDANRATRRERDYALQLHELATDATRSMMEKLATGLEELSGPTQRRLELLGETIAIFDRIDATARAGHAAWKQSGAEVRAAIRTLLAIASAQRALGDFTGARDRADQAVRRAKDLVARAPEVSNRLVLAAGLIEVYRHLPEPRKSHDRQLSEALRILSDVGRGQEKITADQKVEREILYASIFGWESARLSAAGNVSGAEEAALSSVKHGREAVSRNSNNARAIHELASGLEVLAGLQVDRQNSVGFRASISEALSLRRGLTTKFPNDPKFRRSYDLTVATWGSYLVTLGGDVRAFLPFEEPIAILRRLVAEDPGNVELQSELQRELYNFALHPFANKEFEKAIPLLEESLRIGEEFIRSGRSSFQIDLLSFATVARLVESFHRLGKFEMANVLIRFSMDQYLNRVLRNGSGIEVLRAQAVALEVQAENAGLTGKRASAKRQQEDAIGRRRETFNLSGLESDRGLLALSIATLGKWLLIPEELESACYYVDYGLQILREQRQTGVFFSGGALLARIPDLEQLLKTHTSTLQSLERSAHRSPAF